jgi:HlyD family secretion protein
VLSGRVRRVEPSAFTRVSALGIDEQRVNVLIALTSPRDAWGALGDAYHVQVKLVIWEDPNVLRVPQGALFRHGDGFAVFRLEGNVARRVAVTVGRRGELDAEVLQGIADGDRVIVHPSDRVQDGVRVVTR